MAMSFRHHLLAAASALTLALVVSDSTKAADIAAVVVPDWTGFHIGAGVGYGMINHELGLDLDLGQLGTGNLDWSGIGGEGVLGTIEAGYDFQINDQFLIGAQVDYTMSGISTDIDGSIAALGSASYELEASDSVSILVRGGHFIDSSTLLYGLVGWTHTWFNGDLDVRDAGGASVYAASYDFDLDGITVGGGIESAIADNITMKLEYRYTSYEAVDIISGPPIALDASPNVQTIRATLSYRTGEVPAATGGFEEAKWTGFHAGLGGGYGMVNHVLDASSTLGGGASLDFSGVGGEGFLGTAEIGADFQFGERFVVGIEGDYTLSGISTDIDGSIAGLGSANYELEATDSFSILGRAGMLSSPNVLWYGLAGWTHTKFNGDLDVRDDVGASVFAASYDFKSDGLTVGAGFEAMLTDSISWKTEYRYTDYSSVNIIDFGPAFNLDANTNVQSVRSVISWRF